MDKITPPRQKKEIVSNAETLMDEIEAFAQRVENGEYCDGWGWDDAIHEERDWGDESWSAISEFARQYADKYPRAYVDWIAALEMGNNTEAVIQVAREGISQIPRDYLVRAEVAETISRIGEKLNDNQLKLEGYGECFYSNPSMGYLLDLYITAMECGRFEEIREKAEQRIMELRGKSGTSVSNYYDSERNTSSISEKVLCNALHLGGRYEKVFEMC